MINRGDRVYTVQYTEDTIFLLTSAFLQAIEILSTTRILMLGSISFCCTALPRNFCKLSQLLLELFITPRPPTIVVLTNELSRGCTHKNSLLLFMVVSYNLRQSKKTLDMIFENGICEKININPSFSGNDIQQKSLSIGIFE